MFLDYYYNYNNYYYYLREVVGERGVAVRDDEVRLRRSEGQLLRHDRHDLLVVRPDPELHRIDRRL